MSEILTTEKFRHHVGLLAYCVCDKAEQTAIITNHEGHLRLALETATRERDEALRTVKALTPAANYCLEYKPLLLKAERERDEAIRVLRDIATYGWYAKGAKVARAYFATKEGR